MRNVKRILLIIAMIAIALMIKSVKANAYEYIWPVGGNNANETYKDYDFYGKAYNAPYKNGKSGREYIVNNKLWPNEKYYYASCESHYGMDISGINGHKYKIVSVCDGKVIGTSKWYAYGPGDNFADQNQRRASRDGGGYGNYIMIQEESTGRCFLYAHLKGGSIKVNKGDKVTKGQEIATMGSSGDSGHMHLHFEIRKNKSCMIATETIYGYHYIKVTSPDTNLDPEAYIGSAPNVYQKYEDKKLVKISREEAELYIKYLYSTAVGRDASQDEMNTWTDKYIATDSIYEVTKGILSSQEAMQRMGNLSNLDYSKKIYEIILYRGSNYTEQEMSGHVDKMNRGIWKQEDFLCMICNCKEFTDTKLKAIITAQKAVDDKKKEEEKKKQEEEEKRRQEEEEKKRQEEEEKRKQEEEEKKKKEEEEKQKEIDAKTKDVKLYVNYLYRAVYKRNAMDSEISYWANKYLQQVSVGEITRDIFINTDTDLLDNETFVINAYEVILKKISNSESQIAEHVKKLNNRELSRADFIIQICSTADFNDKIYNSITRQEEDRAKKQNVVAIAPAELLTKLGDLDGDGRYTASDASLCLSLISLSDRMDYEYAIRYADSDGDGKITMKDAIYMLSFCAELGAGNQTLDTSFAQYMGRADID